MTNREIKRRIVSVEETVKITKAMYSISVAKMMAAKSQLPAASEYRDTCARIMRMVGASFKDSSYFTRKGDRIGFVVIAADKGLCGDYNSRVFAKAKEELDSTQEKYLFTVGNFARDMFTKAGYVVDVEYLHTMTTFSAAKAIAEDLMYLYENDMLDEVRVIYTDFVNDLVAVERLLPIDDSSSNVVELEPATLATLTKCVQDHLSATLRYILVASSLSEHTARAKIMSQSTDNAEKMIADLSVKYNRARQESITRALQDGNTMERNV